MTTPILYLGRNDTDHTVTFSINGARWEYWLPPHCVDLVEYIAQRWQGRGLARAKKLATYTRRLP